MKNLFWLSAILVVSSLTIGCKKDDNANCSKNVSIAAVQPNTNPVGHEVLIKTSGFTPAAKVVFGSVTATSRAGGAAGEIIAKVPAGLSGNVEITVEEGDCTARSGGFVVGGLPTGVQPSLPNIIVPIPPATLPTGDITNAWVNAAEDDLTNRIFLKGTLVAGFVQLEEGEEASRELDDDPYFNNNPISGTINTNTNVVSIVIDRTSKGGPIEHFDGQFIAAPTSVPDIPANAKYFILLLSRETGRQLLIYFP